MKTAKKELTSRQKTYIAAMLTLTPARKAKKVTRNLTKKLKAKPRINRTPKPNGCHLFKDGDFLARYGTRVGTPGFQNLKNITETQFKKLEARVENEVLTSGKTRFTVEGTAIRHNVKLHYIAQIFRTLNQKGILSQAQREYAHDTNRNPMFGGPASGWAANTYHTKIN
jgi:hypothetical protein